VAKIAEDSGFDAIFAAEVNNDGLATVQLMGSVTERIQVGTWITSVFIRHDYACAQASSLIADATGGRFILGLGASHLPVNRALGVDRPDAAQSVAMYAAAVKSWLRGEGPATHLPQSPAPVSVPVYVAALTSGQVKRAAAVADGLMPIFWSPARLERSQKWVAQGRAEAGAAASFDITMGLPTFIGDDVDQLRSTARENLALYTTFPYYQTLFHVSGFEDEAKRMANGELGASYSDRLLDAICLLGPVGKCTERVAEYRAAGADLPILYPPIGLDATLDVIKAFAR
jgi:alkanesulfonate monooxygenase SsuD/methylene tetrahydromethanopterin reductase-like flavin-dependent oxidoreductase (luciferase family)